MKRTYYIILIIAFISCNYGKSQSLTDKMTKQTDLTNAKLKDYIFLDCMYKDSYFPKFLVEKCKNILINLCENIETEKPKNLTELYALTHRATNEINKLQDEFYENNSEIETAARDCFGAAFDFIAKAYGFDADNEELIATRDW